MGSVLRYDSNNKDREPLRRETEYRILRLPYLFGGAAESLPPQSPADAPLKQGKIVKRFGNQNGER